MFRYLHILRHGDTVVVLIVKAYTFESPYHVWVKLSTRRTKIRIPANETHAPSAMRHEQAPRVYVQLILRTSCGIQKSKIYPQHLHGDAVLLVDVDDKLHLVV
jgi:hypothetical protein